MKFIATLALLVTLSFSAFAAEGQIGSTRTAGDSCVMADGQIGSTKSTPGGDICVLTDGQIGSTRNGVLNSDKEFTIKGLFDSFSTSLTAFLNSF